jgi:hypothetical protein
MTAMSAMLTGLAGPLDGVLLPAALLYALGLWMERKDRRA